ncbi:hypothetical protein Taro_042580 [Colocasia esculenta]|uniref:Uncharacterized protein n=1 Tax=Colocasia esculenta TaxID=4460 RepID=A0A843WWV6_COLES|nr:hypothetical protein [Colocasia esculenta]
MAFLWVLEQAPVQSDVGDALLDDPASSLMQQVAGSSFRTSDFGLQRWPSSGFLSKLQCNLRSGMPSSMIQQAP